MNPSGPFSRNQFLWLRLFANVFFMAVWYFSNQGLLFWDDFSYLSMANDINQGVFEINDNHFTSRIVLLYPVAFFIKIFGINAFTIALYPLLCGLVLLNLVMWLGAQISQWAGIVGGVLVLCDYHLIYFSKHLFPEMPLALCVFVFLVVYYKLLRNEIVPRYAGLLSALALFGAFLIKTTVILLLPLVVFLFINDRRQRRNGSYWLVFISLGLFFLIVNGFWYQEVKGDFLYRFTNIANNHVATPKTFFDKGGTEILKRLTYLPLLGFLKGGFFIPLLAALPAVLKIKRRHFKLDQPEYFWPIASLFLIGTYWFMSTNWRYYSPMPTENRHIVFFIPVFVMTAMHFWPRLHLFEWLRKNYIVIGGIVGLFLIPVYSIYKSSETNFDDMSGLIDEYLVQNAKAQLVITDGLLTYGNRYYYDMNPPEDVYLWFSELETFDILNQFVDSAYLLINPANFNEDYADSDNYDRFIEQMQDNGINIGLLEQRGNVSLYLLTK